MKMVLDAAAIALYVDESWTLRRIAEKYGTDHHSVKRYLTRHGIKVASSSKGRKQKPITEKTRQRLRDSWKGRHCVLADLPRTPEATLRMRATKLNTTRDLSDYDDLDIFNYLVKLTSKGKHLINVECNDSTNLDELRFAFIDNFYLDDSFRLQWQKWIDSGKCKWLQPTLDHIVPVSRGGTSDLSNLQFLPWFENRAKADMTGEEWSSFKMKHKISGDIFVT